MPSLDNVFTFFLLFNCRRNFFIRICRSGKMSKIGADRMIAVSLELGHCKDAKYKSRPISDYSRLIS